MNIPQERLQLTDLSHLTCEYYGVGAIIAQQVPMLLVKFIGSYGAGSEGNGDAAFMGAMVAAGRAAWRPRGLVLDLSELAYAWGNALMAVLDIRHQLPLAVVVGPGCGDAVRQLASTYTGLGIPVHPDWIFEDRAVAIRFLGGPHP